jgi:hypothetical protein
MHDGTTPPTALTSRTQIKPDRRQQSFLLMAMHLETGIEKEK